MAAVPFESFFALKITRPELKKVVLELVSAMGRDRLLMTATLFYLCVLPWARNVFGHGEHYEKNKGFWKRVMAVYNLILCLFSLGIFIATVVTLKGTPLFTEDCSLLGRDKVYIWAVKLFYWSKYVEFLDTFWLYLMNKPLTILQGFHHVGAPFALWGVTQYQAESGWIFMGLNSFIHTFMYFYYGQTLRGSKSKLLGLFKPLLTSLQIIQFVVGLTLLYQYQYVTCYRTDPYKMVILYYYQWFYVGAVCLLFLNFYIRSYIIAPPAKTHSSKKSPAEFGTAPATIGSSSFSEVSSTPGDFHDASGGHHHRSHVSDPRSREKVE